MSLPFTTSKMFKCSKGTKANDNVCLYRHWSWLISVGDISSARNFECHTKHVLSFLDGQARLKSPVDEANWKCSWINCNMNGTVDTGQRSQRATSYCEYLTVPSIHSIVKSQPFHALLLCVIFSYPLFIHSMNNGIHNIVPWLHTKKQRDTDVE